MGAICRCHGRRRQRRVPEDRGPSLRVRCWLPRGAGGQDEVDYAFDLAVAAMGKEYGKGLYWTTFLAGGSVADADRAEAQDA